MASFEEVLRIVIEQQGESELGRLAKSLLDAGRAGETAGSEIDAAAKALAKVSTQQSAIDTFQRLKLELQKTSLTLREAKAGLSSLEGEFDRTDRSSGRVTAAFAKADRQIASLTAKESELQRALNAASAGLVKAGVDAGKLASEQDRVAKESASAAQAIQRIGSESASSADKSKRLTGETSRFGRAISSARDGINAFVGGLLRITGLAGAVSAALGALNVGRFFGGAVSSAREFEAALSEVQAVSGASTEQLQRMRAAAENVSKTTKFSATEAANALGELARASGDADAAISQLPATLQLAQAAGLGAGESANILTTAITQFGLAAEDASRVADLFTREANSTQDTVTGLGLSMSYVAPLARQLGLSIEQTTATLGALAEQGFRGERAGTALRNVFSQMLDPTSKFRDALNGLGIRTNDFGEIITQLAAKGEAGKRALLALDSEARPAISSLVATGGEGMQRLANDFKLAAGEAARTAGVMGANFEGASSRLSNAFDFLRRSLVDPILQPLAKQFDEVSDRIRAFAESQDFARIQAAVKDFALSATRAIIEFVRNINFEGAIQSIEGFAASAKAFFASLSEKAGETGRTLSIAASAISAAFNAVSTGVLGAATVVSGALWGLLRAGLGAVEGMTALSGAAAATRPIFEELRQKIDGLKGVTEEFGRRTVASFDGLTAALDGMGKAASSADAPINRIGGSADRLAGKLGVTAEQASKLASEFSGLPPAAQRTIEPFLRAAGVFDRLAEAAPKAGDGVARAAGSIDEARRAATKAYAEVARLAGAGDTTSASYQRAKVALDQANASVALLTGQSRDAVAGATALSEAQQRLGKTHEQLSVAAANAGRDLDTIYQAYLKTGKGIEDVQAAFDNWAQAQRESVKNSKDWERQTVESMIRVKAATLGVSDATKAIKPPQAPDIQRTLRDYDILANASGNAVEQARADAKKMQDMQAAMTGAMGGALDALAKNMARFSQHSQAAALAYNQLVQDLFERSGAFSQQATADATGIIKLGEAVAQAARLTDEAIAQQQQTMSQVVQSWGDVTDAQLQAFAVGRGGLDNLTAALREQAQAAREGTSEFDLLGTSDLGPLAAALEGAAARVDQLREKTMAAKQAFEDYAASARDQIDQINGDMDKSEDRRFQRELERLQKQAEEAGQLNSSEYADAVSAANELHRLKMQQIQKEDEARRQAEDESASRATQQRQRETGQRPASDAGASNESATTTRSDVSITVNGKDLGGINASDPAALRKFAEALLPEIMRQLQRSLALTGRGR